MDPNKQSQGAPQPPSSYTAPASNYDPNYLDSIAPSARKASFVSGKFGKILLLLLALLIIAAALLGLGSGGQSNTADLQKFAVRLENLEKTTNAEKKNLKSKNLRDINADFQLWLGGNITKSEELLKQSNVKKSDYSKSMVSEEKKYIEALNQKYKDARFADNLDGTYAASMTTETGKLIAILNSLSKKNPSKKIKDFAKEASSNLTAIQKKFDTFVIDGN